MFKSIILLTAFATTAFCVSAQLDGETSKRSWRITSINLEIGSLRDNYVSMDLDAMYDFTKNTALLDRDLVGYSESLYRESTGMKVGASVTISSGATTANWEHEVRLGAFYSTREPLISYNKSVSNSNEYSSIIYCNVVNEASLDGAYILRRKSLRRPWFSFYTGIGATLGATFNNQMVIMEFDSSNDPEVESTHNNEVFEGKESIMSRLYIPFGIRFSFFDRISLGLESNIGVGMQSVINGKSYITSANSGVVLKFGYQF